MCTRNMTESVTYECTLPLPIAKHRLARMPGGCAKMFVADRALTDFYSAVFDIRVIPERGGAPPRHVEVDDIEATLARVWDLGGTIISTDDVVGIGAVPRSAIVRR